MMPSSVCSRLTSRRRSKRLDSRLPDLYSDDMSVEEGIRICVRRLYDTAFDVEAAVALLSPHMGEMQAWLCYRAAVVLDRSYGG